MPIVIRPGSILSIYQAYPPPFFLGLFPHPALPISYNDHILHSLYEVALAAAPREFFLYGYMGVCGCDYDVERMVRGNGSNS